MYVLCVSVSVCVCEEDVHKKRVKKEKWKERIKKQERREKDKNLFIQINRPTDKQTDGQTDRHKSFIDKRYNTEQYSKSNSIE